MHTSPAFIYLGTVVFPYVLLFPYKWSDHSVVVFNLRTHVVTVYTPYNSFRFLRKWVLAVKVNHI